jgi:enamine deaminase RidA (YjgF/YER057c/UK114 family)
MVEIEYLSAPGLAGNVPYHYAAVAPAGRLLFTAGACPLDSGGNVVAPGDFEEQAHLTVANLLAVLAAGGCGAHDLVKTTVYVASADQQDLVRVWNVVAEALAPARPPSTLLGVSVLGYPGQLVEVEAVAVIPEPRAKAKVS